MSVWGKPILLPQVLTLTGNPVTFPSHGWYVDSLSIGISLEQSGSGTPSPDNIRPISAWDGAEIQVKGPDIYDAQTNTIEQGSISSTTGANSTTYQASRLRTNGYIPITALTVYLVSSNIYRVYPHYYDSSYGYLAGESEGWCETPAQILPPSGAAYVRFVLAHASGNIVPSDVTSFEISPVKTYASLWQTTAGKQCIATVDVTGGSITPIRVYLELDGTEDWTLVAAGSGGYPYVRMTLPSQTWSGTAATVTCSHLASAVIASTNKNIGIRVYKAGSGNCYLILRKTSNDTVASIQTWLAEQKTAGTPVQVAYSIAEENRTPVPITAQQILAFNGENVLSSNCGSVTLTTAKSKLQHIS